MTTEERSIFYDQRQRYRWKCEEFKIELYKYLSNYEQRMRKTET